MEKLFLIPYIDSVGRISDDDRCQPKNWWCLLPNRFTGRVSMPVRVSETEHRKPYTATARKYGKCRINYPIMYGSRSNRIALAQRDRYSSIRQIQHDFSCGSTFLCVIIR